MLLRFTLSLFVVNFGNAMVQAGPVIAFGTGSNQFSMQFVSISNAGNLNDTSGTPNPAGQVNYEFSMGMFEVSEDMINKANAISGLGITTSNRGANKPATNVSWFEAATFVNWLNTDQGFSPAYKFNETSSSFELWTAGDAGFDASNPFRNSQARFFLPSSDEWYKAAYYDPASSSYFDFPTASDTAPTSVTSGIGTDTAVFGLPFMTGPADVSMAGGSSPYGTIGQGGNVTEWEETTSDLFNSSMSSVRGHRGGNWTSGAGVLSASNRGSFDPTVESGVIGFRVVTSVPEPSPALYGFVLILGLQCWYGLPGMFRRVCQ